MVTGTGARSVQKWINFSENFTQSPKITTTLSLLDSDRNRNLRVSCKALNISKNKFLLKISTWAGTKLYAARCSWIAHGY